MRVLVRLWKSAVTDENDTSVRISTVYCCITEWSKVLYVLGRYRPSLSLGNPENFGVGLTSEHIGFGNTGDIVPEPPEFPGYPRG